MGTGLASRRSLRISPESSTSTTRRTIVNSNQVAIYAAMLRRRRWILSIVCASLLMASISVAGEIAQPEQPPSDVVYVESNISTPGGNSILAFRRDAQGNLTPLPGSPFLTGGTGVIDPSLKLG